MTWLSTFDLAFNLQAALSSAEARLISSMSRQDVGERAC
ncbi:hypothetical protein EPIR_0392 [Erwinia piriflorinigrans CFBP 5888]|uniref:Uncharacterized protein n=1 Tax=Erwinia piriflorinigrans CFBP 5888 TaxID=1161919 RepID=V5Z3A1_9GAMM|nr:hypothetical protein EPIR_0392 [Erwinia piriflorinigrans CFBP 5888]